MNSGPKIVSFQSGNKTIRRSKYHHELWLVTFPDGGWYSVHASEEGIQSSNPPRKGTVQMV